MTNYEDDDIDDDVEGNEPTEEEEAGAAAAASSNRNFYLALGVMGGIFILLIIGLLAYWLLFRPQGGTSTANATVNAESTKIAVTNAVIMTANAETAAAATQAAGAVLTQAAITPTASNTPVPPTATKTPVLAQATASNTPAAGGAGGGGGLASVTPNLQTRTATIQAVLTQNAQQTQTQIVKARLTGTATALPKTGFAEDVGLPGMFGLAVGLVLVIVLVRRLRLSPNGQ